MELTSYNDQDAGRLAVTVAVRKPRRFKAGAELSATVNLFLHSEDEETPELQVSVRIGGDEPDCH